MKTQKKLFIIFASAILITAFFSCLKKDNFEFDTLSLDNNFNPGIALPLAHVKMKICDFLKEKPDTIVFDATQDSLISIIYSDDSIYVMAIKDLWDIPEVEVEQQTFMIDELSINDEVFINYLTLSELGINVSEDLIPNFAGLQFPDIRNRNLQNPPLNFKRAKFSEGNAVMSITNNFPVPITAGLIIELLNVNESQPFATFVFADAIQPGETVNSLPANLAGKTLTNNLLVSFLNFGLGAGTNVQFDHYSDNICIQIALNDVFAESGDALISQKTFPIDTIEFAFNENNDERLRQIQLKSGILQLDISSLIQAEFTLKLRFLSILHNNNYLERTIKIKGRASSNDTTIFIDLANTNIDLTLSDKQEYNTVIFEYEIYNDNPTNYIHFEKDDEIKVSAKFANLDFTYAEGYFGYQAIVIEKDIIDLNIDFFDQLNGGFILTNPKFHLKVTNYSINAPVALNLNMQGISNKNVVVPLDYSFPQIALPDQAYATAFTNMTVDRSNSAIVELMALPPERIQYYGSLNANPTQNPDINNFATGDGKIIIGLEMEIPLELKTDNITFNDTVDISDISEEDLENVSAMKLLIDYVNEMPLNANVNLIFYKSDTKQELDILAVELLRACTVDQQGNFVAATNGTAVIELTPSQISNLGKADQLIFDAHMSTPATPANVGVKLRANASLDLHCRIKAATSFSTN